MATEAVLEREEQVTEHPEAEKQEERPRLFKRFAAGFGASIAFPVPPDQVPDYWFN